MGFEDWYDASHEPGESDGDDIRCKFCGVDGLHWENVGDAWLLVTLGGHRHRCPGDVPAKPSDPRDDFKEFIDQ